MPAAVPQLQLPVLRLRRAAHGAGDEVGGEGGEAKHGEGGAQVGAARRQVPRPPRQQGEAPQQQRAQQTPLLLAEAAHLGGAEARRHGHRCAGEVGRPVPALPTLMLVLMQRVLPAPLLPLPAAVAGGVAGSLSANPPGTPVAVPSVLAGAASVVSAAAAQVVAAAAAPWPLRWARAPRQLRTTPSMRQLRVLLLGLLREGAAARQAAVACPPLPIGQLQAPPAGALRLGCEAPCARAWRCVRACEGRLLLLPLRVAQLLLLMLERHAVARAWSAVGAGPCQLAAACGRGGAGKQARAAAHARDAGSAAEPAEAPCAAVELRAAEGCEGGGRGQAGGDLQQALPAAAAPGASVAGAVCSSRCAAAAAAAAARPCPSAGPPREECGRGSAEERGARLAPAVRVSRRETQLLLLLLLQAGEVHLSLPAALQHGEEGSAHTARPSQAAAAVALAVCRRVMGERLGPARALRLQLQVPACGVATGGATHRALACNLQEGSWLEPRQCGRGTGPANEPASRRL